MIKFCSKCGAIMKPIKEGDKIIMTCSCGHTSKGKPGSLKEDKKIKKEEVELAVIDKEIEILPITKEICPKCGNKKAYYWLIQTRSGDESETKFMRCTKCKHTWRDYS